MNISKFNKLIDPFDAIIFDYGGVFIDIDYERTMDAFRALSPKVSAIYSKASQTSLFNDFEVGKLTIGAFLEELTRQLGLEVKDQHLVQSAWCAMLLELRIERVEYLKLLSKSNKRIFMLSNINAVHEKYMLDYIETKPELAGFYDLFEHVYFSHHLGMRKPNKNIFEHVIKTNGLDPSKTLFIDDSPQHIAGAIACGLKTLHLEPANTFITG